MTPKWLDQVSFGPPEEFIGANPVYRISDPTDIRLAFYRLTKCRDHRVYSALYAVMLEKDFNFVLGLTTNVVKRALSGCHEIVSIMLTEE